jgi:hypothetical protein
MKLFLVAILLISTVSFSQVNFTESNLPIVVITTQAGDTIKDDPRIFCHMGIIDNGFGNQNYMTDPFNDYDGQISIEIRGSTSQQYPKKGYGLETQDSLGNNNNVSILGMPVENDWILYGPYPDKTLIRNVMTFHIARQMGNYASNTVYCELVINGEYKGLYVMMEKIKRDNDRVDITRLDSLSTTGDSLTGGYVFKVDKTTGSIVDTWTSAYNPEVLFQYHDPKPDKMHLIQKTYLQSYVSNFEDVMNGPNFDDHYFGYHDIIDRISFYDFFFLQEIGRTVDGYRSSSFLHKDRNSIWGGHLTAGPMWDFNLSYGNADYCDANLTTGWQYEFDNVCPWFTSSVPFWWGKLLTDSSYTNGLMCRWEILREGPLHIDTLHNYIDSIALHLEEARIRNFQQWPIIGVYVNWNGYVGSTYQEDLDYLKQYIEDRILWMDANLPGTCWPGLASQEEIIIEEPLSRAWPNPFSDFLFIGFTVQSESDITIKIHDLKGAEIAVFNQGVLSQGNYVKEWRPTNIENGVYVYSIYKDGELYIQDKLVKGK